MSTDKSVHDLHTFMAEASADMASEYTRIFSRSAEDPGTAGDEGEANWATFLKGWLPAGYHVKTKGRLIGANGILSKQIDIVVLKPSYPPKLLEKKIWLAGGVVAVFECKTTLKNADIKSSLSRSGSFKNLLQEKDGNPREELLSSLIYGLLAHSHCWKSANSDPLINIQNTLDSELESVSEPRLGIDVVCVADLGTWHKRYIAKYEAAWNPHQQKSLETAFGAHQGPMTSMIGSRMSSSLPHRPIGALVAYLFQRMAWNDPTLRDVADYYRIADLLGPAVGNMRPWPLSVYSEAVKLGIASGKLSNGIGWDNWAISGP